MAFVVLCGVAAIVSSLRGLLAEPIGSEWLVLAALTILTGSFSVKVSSINAYISVSETFVFASVLLFGTAAGTITVLLECFVILLWMKPQGRPVHRMLFNLAAPSVAIWVAGTAFYLLSGIAPYSKVATPLPALFLPLLAFTVLYFLLNSWLVAIAVGLENHRPVFAIWWKNFAWLSVNYFSGASVAALIVTYTRTLQFSTLVVIVPLLVVSYLTFRTAMGRAEDTYNHLSELNKLYLSTIETLAMAIDAKDQITHGHIRRVQAFAIGLAKRIGVADERLLKAIEAAALLHDMGKLAIPEHILNKPGKLTPAEFDRMKLHATIGADLLSAINFPYPVVPIVRHHHENWNGSGYPTGLSGTDIPIGARILSVVDCFDALTSDRPYRPRLSDQEAIAILLERRGSMYDPLVVDTFIRVYAEISPTIDPGPHSTTMMQTFAAAQASSSFEATGNPRREDHTERALRAAFAAVHDFPSLGEELARALRSRIELSAAIIFLYDLDTDSVVARHVIGDRSKNIGSLAFSLGERMSGWVAAQRRAIANGDARLDLGDATDLLTPRPKASISIPLVHNGRLLGVLSIYSAHDTLSEDQIRYAELLADMVCGRLEDFDQLFRQPVDPVSGLPLSTTLTSVGEVTRGDANVTLLVANIVGLGDINRDFGRERGDQIVLHVANHLKDALSAPSRLFRHPHGDFVACLAGVSDVDAVSVVRELRRALRANPYYAGDGRKHDVQMTIHTMASGTVTNETVFKDWLSLIASS